MSRHQSIREKSIAYSLKACPAKLSAKHGAKVCSPRSAVCGLRSAVCPRAGFTLIEMLAVVAIIMLLAGMILAGVILAKGRGKVLTARRDIAQLKSAWDTYYADYNAFPDPTQITGNSIANGYMVTGRDVIQILRGRENHRGQNSREIPYMDFHVNTTDFNDPWGNPYRVALDVAFGGADPYDGEVDIPGGTLRVSVAAWSAGEDGDDDTYGDNICTWRK